MDMSLFAILGFCWSFAALLYYFLFVKKVIDIGGRGRAGIFAILFVITPILLVVLLDQSGAEGRLNKIGFAPYPEFSGSVGIATGTGLNPIWVFSTDAETASVIQFYKVRVNHGEWTLVAESRDGLKFEKDDQYMSIHVGDGNVVFSSMAKE